MAATKKNSGLHQAFGEWKSIGAWARDPRCHISKQGLYLRVTMQGLSIKDALKMGSHENRRKRLTIEGQTKTIREWAADPRSRAKAGTIRYRVRVGWPDDLAVMSPPSAPSPPKTVRPENRVVRSGKRRGRPPILVVAWGEEKTLAEWANDPRAKVKADCIRSRLKNGNSPEAAISQSNLNRATMNESACHSER